MQLIAVKITIELFIYIYMIYNENNSIIQNFWKLIIILLKIIFLLFLIEKYLFSNFITKYKIIPIFNKYEPEFIVISY